MKFSLFRKLAVATALTAMAGTGMVSAASAAEPPATSGAYCDTGHHCVFYQWLGSSRKMYFNSDPDFTNDRFPNGAIVNDNVWSASNSSTGGYESHYYYGTYNSGGLVFCVNPGMSVEYTMLTDDGVDGNGIGQRDEASSLQLRPTTTIRCVR
jgi:hypothetical protein